MISKKTLIIILTGIVLLNIILVKGLSSYLERKYEIESSEYKVKYEVEQSCHTITKLRMNQQKKDHDETAYYLKLTFDELVKCRDIQ